MSARLDLRLDAVFLWIMPLAAALSSLEKTVFIFSFASSNFAPAIRARSPLTSFLRPDLSA